MGCSQIISDDNEGGTGNSDAPKQKIIFFLCIFKARNMFYPTKTLKISLINPESL